MKTRRGGQAALLFSLALTRCSGADADMPRHYRRIDVPVAQLRSDEARSRGRALFLEHCTLCHGERADGHGLRREAFNRPPADFTDPAWQRRTSDRRAYFAIREGVAGTAMPSWRSLEEGETWDLVAYVKTVADAPRNPR
jgi:mono/diheme cytochrome c family protein